MSSTPSDLTRLLIDSSRCFSSSDFAMIIRERRKPSSSRRARAKAFTASSWPFFSTARPEARTRTLRSLPSLLSANAVSSSSTPRCCTRIFPRGHPSDSTFARIALPSTRKAVPAAKSFAYLSRQKASREFFQMSAP